MGSRYLTDLAAVCRRTGLAVTEVDGWTTRARSSGGYNDGRPTHAMVHHTASGKSSDGWPDVNYCCYGSDSRPVANLYLSRSGGVWVMAAGATNTNGKGGPLDGVPADSMNTYAVGIEAGNDGVGEPWPTAQQDGYVALVAVLVDAYGLMVRSHFEWAPDRKVDPAGPSRWSKPSGGGGGNMWRMADFRAETTGGGLAPSSLMEGKSMFFMFRVVEHADPRPTFVCDGVTYWQIAGADVTPTINAMQTAMGYPDSALPIHPLALASLKQWNMTCRQGTTAIENWKMR